MDHSELRCHMSLRNFLIFIFWFHEKGESKISDKLRNFSWGKCFLFQVIFSEDRRRRSTTKKYKRKFYRVRNGIKHFWIKTLRIFLNFSKWKISIKNSATFLTLFIFSKFYTLNIFRNSSRPTSPANFSSQKTLEILLKFKTSLNITKFRIVRSYGPQNLQ